MNIVNRTHIVNLDTTQEGTIKVFLTDGSIYWLTGESEDLEQFLKDLDVEGGSNFVNTSDLKVAIHRDPYAH